MVVGFEEAADDAEDEDCGYGDDDAGKRGRGVRLALDVRG